MREKLSRFHALASYGYPAFACHRQLMAILVAQGEPQLQDYFAEPVLDEDKRQIQFLTDLDGSVKRLSDLSPAEREAAAAAMAGVRDALDACAESLKSTSGTTAGGGLKLLELARRVPAVDDAPGEFLRFVDGHPVVCFWGFEDPHEGGLDPAAAEIWGDTEAGAGDGETASAEEPVAPAPRAPPARPAPPAPKPVAPPAPVAKEKSARPAKPPPPPRAPAPPPSTSRRSPPARPVLEAGRGDGRAPVRRRWSLPGRRVWLWSALVLLVLLVPAYWALKTFTGVFPMDFDADGTPRTQGRSAGAPLSIPINALEKSDLSFLTGVWQLGTDRLPIYRGTADNVIGSYRLVVQFNAKGEGRVFGVEREFAGKPGAGCSGSATARAVGQKLYFETLVCVEKGGGGRNLLGSRHECTRLPEGQTQCRASFIDGEPLTGVPRRLS